MATARRTLQTVDEGGCPEKPSLALDPAGNPGLAYDSAEDKDLRYAHRQGSRRVIETVDVAEDVGQSASLTQDASGEPAIACFDSEASAVKHARRSAGTWGLARAVSGGYRVALALDSAGRLHIACASGSLSGSSTRGLTAPRGRRRSWTGRTMSASASR